MLHSIGQHLIVGISGPSLTSDEKKFIVENNIGGVVLFSRNLVDPKQVHGLCHEIQSLRYQLPEKTPLFIGVDMEGGSVHRLKAPFTQWPAVQKLGQLDNPTVSFHFAHRMGLELKSVGINLNFAPCVDILTNPKNKVIGDRAISGDPEMVAKHASALVRGYVKSEILSCAKHFPGHGNTITDSHEDLPVEHLDLEELEKRELIPFRRALKSRVDMIMTSHIHFSKIDPQWPVTLSARFIQDLLRQEMRYKGLICTDDLGMKAMTQHFSQQEIPVQALRAGADLLLYCNDFNAPAEAIEAVTEAIAQGTLSRDFLEASTDRILQVKRDKLDNPDPLPIDQMLEVVGHAEHLRLAQAIARGETPAGLIES